MSTNVGGISDIVTENKTALLSSLDVDDFSEKLLSLINDKEKRENMTQYACENSLQQFGYQRLCQDMDNLYKSLKK